MSTLRVDNLQASDGLSPAFETTTIARVAFRYDEVAGNITRISINVASFTDNGLGDFTATNTNNFASATEQMVLCTTDETGAVTSIITMNPVEASILTSSCRYETARVAAADNRTNLAMNDNVAHHSGDLA